MSTTVLSSPVVLHVASEALPFAKTGGLADVTCALPRAQASHGARPIVVVPKYRGAQVSGLTLARRLAPVVVPLGARRETVIVHEGTLPGGRVRAWLIEHPFFDRDGLYGDAKGGGEYADNPLRFALLAQAALHLAHHLDAWPDVVHGHDWQAGLVPYLTQRHGLAGRPTPKTMFTIHNLAFRGLFAKSWVEELGLGWDVFTPETGEFYDQLCFLKAGLAFADAVTTVSPRYAREIMTAEHGYGLDGYLRSRAHKLHGILNGIDLEEWNPETDAALPVRFDAVDPSGKATVKTALQRELGLPVRPSIPLVASLGRLVEQKGIDLALAAADDVLRDDVQLVFFGTGEARFEQGLRELARRYPTKVAARFAEADPAAHRLLGGADLFLMPSREEPCGLTQLYALRYGAVPVVRATGGLDDTVVDYDERTRTGNGFKFDELDPAALARTLRRALGVFRHRDRWTGLVAEAMRQDFGWAKSAARYVSLYRRLLGDGNAHAGHGARAAAAAG